MADPGIPDQRLRVVVSSHLGELYAERAAVRAAIEALHLVPVLPEQRRREPRELGQVFVGVYGRRYDSSLEEDYERSAGMPRLLYLQAVPDRDDQLSAMIERFQDEAAISYAHFRDPDGLSRVLSDDLVVLLSERFLQPADAPAPPTPALPVPLTGFVGRERELREIGKLLAAHRLVTITGPGGSGKTRLMLELLSQQQGQADVDGPWLVELAGLEDPGLVPSVVVDALGLLAQPGQDPSSTLVSLIGERRMLLAVDNCEHVVDAVSALVAPLLAGCPNLCVLATSREALRLRGEHVYPLQPLPVTVEDALGNQADGDAMRLFEARAAAVVPGFAIDEGNRDAVRMISERLDGLPLAIELAAARLHLLSPQQLVARLDDRFALLKRGSRDVSDRQKALLAAIDWSFDLLPVTEQQLFVQLSVFRGGFELDAVERVSGGGVELLDLLANLIAKSLVSADGDGQTVRYRLLESLREYGRRRLDAHASDELQRAHLAWCRDLVDTANRHLRGQGAGEWFDRLDREQDNLRAALAYALDTDAPRVALRIVGILGWFWFRRGYLDEGRHWTERALAASPEQPDPDRAAALLGLAGLDYLSGRMVEAAEHARQAVADAEQVSDELHRARGLVSLAYLQAALGDLGAATASGEAGRKVAHAAGLDALESEADTALGLIARVQGRLDDAGALLSRGAEIAERIGYRWQEGNARWLLSKVALDRGDADLAFERLRDSLRIIVSERDRTSTLVGLHSMAGVLAARGAAGDGAMLIGAVAAAGERIGFWPERMDPLDAAATVARVRAALDDETYDRSVTLGRRLTVEQATSIAVTSGP